MDKGNPASTAFRQGPYISPKKPVVCAGFAVRADFPLNFSANCGLTEWGTRTRTGFPTTPSSSLTHDKAP